jgi:hypothetical protein
VAKLETDSRQDMAAYAHVRVYIEQSEQAEAFETRTSSRILIIEGEKDGKKQPTSGMTEFSLMQVNKFFKTNYVFLCWLCGYHRSVDSPISMVYNLLGQLIDKGTVFPDKAQPKDLGKLVAVFRDAIRKQLQFTPVVCILDSVHMYLQRDMRDLVVDWQTARWMILISIHSSS